MLNAIRNSQSDLASSYNKEEGVDKKDVDDDSALGKLSEVDEPCGVMATLTKTIQNFMVSFWQKRIMLDKLTQTEGGNVGVQFGE
jgi:hypothetical protein